MSGIFGSAPKVNRPAPPPMVDDAVAKLNAEDASARRLGRRSTILTSDNGLPNLGTTTRTGQ